MARNLAGVKSANSAIVADQIPLPCVAITTWSFTIFISNVATGGNSDIIFQFSPPFSVWNIPISVPAQIISLLKGISKTEWTATFGKPLLFNKPPSANPVISSQVAPKSSVFKIFGLKLAENNA